MSDIRHNAKNPAVTPATTIVQPGQVAALQAQTPPPADPSETSLSIPAAGVDTTARARHAAETRWANARAERYDWQNAPIDEALQHLVDLRRDIEQGARTLNQRTSTSNDPTVPCAVCHKDIQNGRWMQERVVRNPDTGLQVQAFLCSVRCINSYATNPTNYAPRNFGPTGLPKPEPSQAVQAELAKQAKQSQPKEAREHGVEGMLT